MFLLLFIRVDTFCLFRYANTDRSFICFSIVSLNSNVDQYETFVFFRLSVLQCVHVSKDMQGYDRLRVMSRAPVNAKVSGHFFVSDVVHCGFLFVLF